MLPPAGNDYIAVSLAIHVVEDTADKLSGAKGAANVADLHKALAGVTTVHSICFSVLERHRVQSEVGSCDDRVYGV